MESAWDSQQELVDEIKNFVQKQHELQQIKGKIHITSESQLAQICFENFHQTESDFSFYKYRQHCSYMVCENCYLFCLVDEFERLIGQEGCKICQKNNFTFF